MIGNDFQTAGKRAYWQTQFTRFEADLRRRLEMHLDAALKASKNAAPAPEPVALAQVRRRMILNVLAQALDPASPARLVFQFENVLPLRAAAAPRCFQEALVRLYDEAGTVISPHDMFAALEGPAHSTELVSSLRDWMNCTAIREFYNRQPHVAQAGGLSVNILPQDLESPLARRALEDALNFAQACAYGPLTLEATEYRPWTPDLVAFLSGMANQYGAGIALDDYGAPQGHNGRDTLEAFAAALRPDVPLTVKIDGTVVRDFLERGDETLVTHLRDIEAACPRAMVVAEWIADAGEARMLITRLRPYGLDHAIDMVQGHGLTDAPEIFLGKMAGPARATPALRLN